MKVIFCVLNSKYIHSSLAPWCLYTACKEKCGGKIDFSVVEGTVNENQDELLERILSQKGDIVCFSCYIWNKEKTLSLCGKIKEKSPAAVTVLGGPEVAYNQKQVLEENPFVDYISSGEGENILPFFFLDMLEGKPCTTEGMSFIKDGETLVSFGRENENAVFPSPYCKEYFDSLKGRIAYIESSRGCPFSCAFCLSGRVGKVRFFPLERVKKEMLLLASSGSKTIKFVDRTFNCNKERAAEILLFIKKNYGRDIPKGVCFHFEIAADLLDEKLLSVIESMPEGSVQFEAGIQSFNENTLRAINRRTDTEKVAENIKKLVSFGNCHIHIDLIAGLPEENFESFVKGFNKAYYLKADMLQLGFLKILHGSPMGDHPERYPCCHKSEPPYEVYSTPYLTQEETLILHKTENELDRLYNSSRFTESLDYVLSVSEKTPFELFYGFALFLSDKGAQGIMPLDKYTCFVYDYFSSLPKVDKLILRDKMLLDRMAGNPSGVIPERLKVADSNLKKARKFIASFSPEKKGVLRTVAILYSENKIAWCDYEGTGDRKGKFKVNFADFLNV